MSRLTLKLLKFFVKLKALFNLRADFDQLGTSKAIVSNIEFKSGNAWSLVFAIFIASIGLAVNSTAVVIGAMLISPLMGPIIGAGFAIGIRDFELLKKSFKNLFYAIVISLVTSTLFFVLSPDGPITSELLSRTQPTFFDVMIAFFGGAAGIVALSRTQKGNAVPGVAIATALMPPLCTAGYGIANSDISIALGALYLFIINATFILISTYLFVRLLKFPSHIDDVPEKHRAVQKVITWVAVIAMAPSLIIAWYLHEKTIFETQSQLFIENEFNSKNLIVAQKQSHFDLQHSKIIVKIFGGRIEGHQEELIKSKLINYKLENVDLEIIPITAENISQNELEQKFVTKKELAQLLEKKINNGVQIGVIQTELNEKFGQDAMIRLYLIENAAIKVEVLWKIIPSSKTKKLFQRNIMKQLDQYQLYFNHLIKEPT